MKEFLSFLALIGSELYDLFQYGAGGGSPDPQYEEMLAKRIVRKIADDRARREIPNP